MSDGIGDAYERIGCHYGRRTSKSWETLEAALHAAETGHLVMATMHTQRAVMVHHLISLFPGVKRRTKEQ